MPVEKEYENYIELIKQSLNDVEEGYFYVKMASKERGRNGEEILRKVVRERVFCYELYHQFRLNFQSEDATPLCINGEIDKSGSILFKKTEQRNPDFVFHVPGTNEGNTVVREVKGKGNKKGIKKDFETLFLFVANYNYKIGIFILFNSTKDKFVKDMKSELKAIFENFGDNGQVAQRILILTKTKDQEVCESIWLSEIFEDTERLNGVAYAPD